MNDKEALTCLDRELKKYRDDLIANIHSEIIGDGIYFGSSFSIAYLSHLLFDKISFNQTIIPAIVIPTIISIKNHSTYARSNEVKQNIKFLKSLKKEIINGSNPFEDVSKEAFSKVLKDKYDYRNILI